jgi:hypothetical protein
MISCPAREKTESDVRASRSSAKIGTFSELYLLTARRSRATIKLSMEVKMKQNITLRLDKDLIKRGKVIASKKDTSLNRLLSDFLKQIVDEEDHYEQCKRKALNILDKGYYLGGKITYTREELHER